MKPIFQISVDHPDLNKALEIAEDAVSSRSVEMIAIGKKLIKSEGLRAVREFKERFPDKRIIVDVDILGRSRKLKNVIDAGADVLLISGDTSEDTIKNFVKEFKKSGVEIMVDLTRVRSPVDSSKRLQEIDTDYLLVDLKNLEKVSKSVITPIAVAIDSKEGNLAEAVEHGAQIIALSESITTADNIKEVIEEITALLERKHGNDTHLDSGYIDMVTKDLDNIKNILLNLEKQRRDDEEHKLQMRKDLEDMENRFRNILKIERDKMEEERDILRKQAEKIGEGWQKLKDAENRLEEKQRNQERENKKRWGNLVHELGEEIKKRTTEHDTKEETREAIREDMDTAGELEEIRDEWEEMEKIWRGIDKDKKDMEEKRKAIEEEWGRIEEMKKRGIDSQKGNLEPEEVGSKEGKRDEILTEELSEVEGEWREIEDVWTRIEEDKREIEEKRKAIGEEWEKIEGMKGQIERDQEMIKEQLRDMEEMKNFGVSNLPKLVSRITSIRDQEMIQLNELQEERKELEDRRKEVEEAEKKIKTERGKLLGEIKKLEEEWGKIKEIRRGWEKEEELRRTAGKAIADLEKLKKEHEKQKPEKKENLVDGKTKETINRLLDLINKRGEIRLKDAAKELSIQEYLLRRWCNILENRGIIEIKAPLLGDIVLKKGAKMDELTGSE
ncbi:MAG: hypothetical protein JW778_02595 [Candidatus Altiarchaeota archaeon]|nr:hypothetical protein [Candidatus Altiarchaeota archaeon]